MSIGEAILSEAFEAMGWPSKRVQQVAAWMLLGGMLGLPVTFRHALLAYANREAGVVVHQIQKALPQPTPSPVSR